MDWVGGKSAAKYKLCRCRCEINNLMREEWGLSLSFILHALLSGFKIRSALSCSQSSASEIANPFQRCSAQASSSPRLPRLRRIAWAFSTIRAVSSSDTSPGPNRAFYGPYNTSIMTRSLCGAKHVRCKTLWENLTALLPCGVYIYTTLGRKTNSFSSSLRAWNSSICE